MIKDALAGKIDLIITKSVSRFARNTVDSLTTIRKLKEKGIEVYFEKENIWTLDAKGELLLTIMSSLAQEEARNISENTTWGKRKMFSDGRYHMNYSRFLGYDKGPDGGLVINEEQAKVVRFIYKSYLSGLSTVAIAKKHCIFLEPEEDDYKISENYLKLLNHPEFSDMIYELIEFGCHRWEQNYQNTYKETDLVLYQKYTYEDVCRLLCWEKNEVPLNIGGYKYDQKTQTFPVFINYDKDETISDTTRYEDHFLSSNLLIAISKSGRSLDSEDVQNFLKAKERGISVELFVRKNKDDKISKEFYYLGRMTATGKAKEFQMPNTTKTAVEIEWLLDTPVREDIYDYIVNS